MLSRRILNPLSIGSLTKKATTLSTPVANLKLSPVTQLAYSTTRAKDWDDILTAHKQESVARTWSLREKKLGKWVMNLNEAGPSTDKGKKKAKKVPAGSVKVRMTAHSSTFELLNLLCICYV